MTVSGEPNLIVSNDFDRPALIRRGRNQIELISI